MFYPGETDTHIFTLPFAAEELERAVVSYKQRGKLVLELESDQFESTGDEECTTSVTLTQEDSLK